MKKMIEQFFCDICKNEAETVSINYPVIFHTEQTEGRACKPYINQKKLDICEKCKEKILMLNGWGAQGCNRYEIKEDITAYENPTKSKEIG